MIRRKMFLLLAVMSVLHADEAECKWMGHEDLPMGTTPSVKEFCEAERGKQFCFDVAFIYWRVMQQQMDVSVSDTDGTTLRRRVTEIDASYKPGFMLCAGYDIGYDNWVAGISYNRLWRRVGSGKVSPTGGTNTTGTASGTGAPLRSTTGVSRRTNLIVAGAFTSADYLTKQSDFWTCGLDKIDFFLMRPFFLGRKLKICPKIGLNATWIKQRRRTDTMSLSGATASETSSSDSYLVGPMAEWCSCWCLQDNFALVTAFGGACLFQNWKVTVDPLIIGSATTPTLPRLSADNGWQVTPYIMASLGIEWNSAMMQEEILWTMRVVYTFRHYWGQNLIRKVMIETAGDALGTVAIPSTDVPRVNTASSFDAGGLSYHGFTFCVGARF